MKKKEDCFFLSYLYQSFVIIHEATTYFVETRKIVQIKIKSYEHDNPISLITKYLEPVCCKKQQKKVPDQLLHTVSFD